MGLKARDLLTGGGGTECQLIALSVLLSRSVMQNDDTDTSMPGKPACPPVGEAELWLFFGSSIPSPPVLRTLVDRFCSSLI